MQRTTNQRLKILEYLRGVKTHPTAEMVYLEVKKELPAISLATVYRNLNNMADEGRILRFEVGKEYHFDSDTCCHQHFVCRDCGRIIDVFQKEISEFAMRKVKGVKPDCVSIIYHGICRNCGGE
jgi:Fe2+ or Zn2+ uptake regulation protein